MRTAAGKAAAAATAISVTALVASGCDPDAPWGTSVFRFALAGIIIACTTWVLAHMTVSEAALSRAHAEGYDDGYSDACAEARTLRIVPELQGTAVAVLGSAAKQLGE